VGGCQNAGKSSKKHCSLLYSSQDLSANNLPGWTQGGSSADNIVGHFAVTYHNEASNLGIDLNELYAAMKADGEVRAASLLRKILELIVSKPG
jgi:hypothetical protein